MIDLDTTYTIDIETNDLLAEMLDFSSFPYKLKPNSKLWVVSITNVGTGETVNAIKENVTKEWLRESLKDCTVLIAHNGIKFDFITLKLFGVLDYSVGYLNEKDTLFGKEVALIDTLILSRLANPDRFGGHSLKAWGERLGNYKDDFRTKCIEANIIDKKSKRGAEFSQFSDLMVSYCDQDTKVNADIYKELLKEFSEHNWGKSVKIEHKLADLAIRRESLGFWFDKDLAIKCVEDLTEKMEDITNKINPLLPPKPMNKGELNTYTPPKRQITKSGDPTSYIIKFVDRIGAQLHGWEDDEGNKEYEIRFEKRRYRLPHSEPLKTTTEATIDDLDHVKMTLINDYGWVPSEWKERDLTKDSKKQYLPYEKRIAALERWYKETMEGKYTKGRLKELGIKPDKIIDKLSEKLNDDYPVRVPTSPPIRVGVEKELCPNLLKLGEEAAFAKDFALYLTYKHRKSSIAGGDIEEMDLEEDVPNTGFLSAYREIDGRIPTPAIEIGASTSRYRHISVANIARPTSVYGKEMRSLFGCGEGAVFFGFDYASLEARIMAHYVFRYKDGVELGKTFLAEKPHDLHTRMAEKMGVERSDAKSINYGIIYGAQWNKIRKMTGKSPKESKEIVNNFWSGAPALKQLRDKAEEYWESTDKKFVLGIDGRKINIRSKHSILNALFQSAGVIYAKYVSVLMMEKLEKNHNLCIDPFISKPDICSMIEYHDEQDMYANPKLFKFEIFETKEVAEKFVEKWEGRQLSAIGKGKKGYFVCLPNAVSTSIEDSMKEVEKGLKLNVPMGFEYMLGRNWYECH